MTIYPKRRKIMKKIISIIISLLFIISALLPLTSVSAADSVLDLQPDGTVVFVPNFNGEAGIYEPGILSGAPKADVDPTNPNTITFQTTTNKSASYWGGFIETLPLNERTCYTIYYTVSRTGNHSVGVYADSVYGAYGYPNRIKLMNKGSSLSGHDYVQFSAVSDTIYSTTDAPSVQEYALEVNGVNCTTATYIKDNTGKYLLVDQSVEGQIPYFMADVLGLFFYSYYSGHVVTISDCYIVKGLSFGEVVYPEPTTAPETTEAPTTTAAPETKAPEPTAAPETDAPTEAAQPEATKAPEVETKPEEPAKKSGCGAVISGSVIIATAILAVPVFVRRKRK